MRVGAILLAGGVGARMGAAVPKQYLELGGKPIIRYSFEVLSSIEVISELVVVCEERYRGMFDSEVRFAAPGARRQDSVESGLRALSEDIEMVLIHDGARPFISFEAIERVLEAGNEVGAAVLGIQAVATMKEVDEKGRVIRTVDRETLWEMQTPQVLRKDWLYEGLEFHRIQNSTVTDDVALIEQFSYPIQVIKGDSFNRKITTREDLRWAEVWLAQNRQPVLV